MIRYRVKRVKRPFTYVQVWTVCQSNAYLLLPNEIVTNSEREYATTYVCDDIQTSKKVNLANDHQCHHVKIDGTINGKLVKSSDFTSVDMFGYFSQPVVEPSRIYSWLQSSGAGPRLTYKQCAWGVSIGPGICEYASATQNVKARGLLPGDRSLVTQTYSSQVFSISPGHYLLVNTMSNCSTNFFGDPDFGTLGGTLYFWDATDYYTQYWTYKLTVVSMQGCKDTTISTSFQYNPEVYFGDQIRFAIKAKRFSTPAYIPAGRIAYGEPCCSLETSGVSPTVAKDVARKLRVYTDSAFAKLSVPSVNVWSDLCVTAIQQCQQIDINSLAYVRDLVGLREELSSLKSLLSNWKNPKTYLRAFLSSKYGMVLTVSDTKKLISAVQTVTSSVGKWNKSFQVVRAKSADIPSSSYRSFSNFSRDFHYKIYYNPIDNGILNCIRTLMDWDLWPTLQNDWDLVPCSFVIDWSIKVDELCERIDACIYAEYLDVYSVLYTTKVAGDVSLDLSSYGIESVKFTATKYDRTFKSQLDLPSFRLDFGSDIFSHIPEATSIIALLL